jgi:rhodanese-related sulfurtransferase
MRWKQLFLPVQSIDSQQAGEMMEQSGSEELEILDVRQPREYEKGHIPGAKLIPLPDLENRLFELDPGKPHIVY